MCGAHRIFTISSHVVQLAILMILLLGMANADCECGYATPVPKENGEVLFTDLLETDFTHLNHLPDNTDWLGQTWNKSSKSARGEFGEKFSKDNIVPNPARSSRIIQFDTGANGKAAGLDLVVRSKVVDDMVPCAELDSTRSDLLWGSFRAGLKLTKDPGTCAAFFWYYNDTQEIDMEFLSQEFDASKNVFPVNLVLQSRAAAEAGYNAQATGNFKKINLPFDPAQDFHEYRMDFLPGRVIFYADGQPLAEMTGDAVPDHPGHLILQHWSNGNALWSGGPPTRDAMLTVAYVRAYFNSSSDARKQDWEKRCRDPAAPGAVCHIPEKVSVANPALFSTVGNMANNQTVSAGGFQASRSLAAGANAVSWFAVVVALLCTGFCSELC
ncbi:hypothetical protein MCOR02_005651 [Pyricularia oryzae]|nr:hypothetical protein MCOR02_005651 [Pyricularia oryzae]KAI6467330.1 hypothetical protein MCOR17_004513 [Pyricularia oryzae]KAI6495275.1 hypothetical protein MCOR13_007229 [Pyricularia oryzae]KAI6593310.1 hypothetical protein MCOR04_003386 [Pyricularia oryzae]KAI6609846.1 hypothetical protein MCOR07_011210 [Pyricularia oryzae]